MSVTIDRLLRDEEPAGIDLEGGGMILSLRVGAYFGFNRVATVIWHMLAVPRHVGQIFDSLAERHDADAATLARNATLFLQTLMEYRLMRVTGASKPP